jgi:hypothetical protein
MHTSAASMHPGSRPVGPCVRMDRQHLQASQQVPTSLLPLAGVTEEPDAAGYYTYTRPEGKSGGHGVGWSEVPRYSFKVPGGWEETPVSIADLGGTEVRQGGSCSKQYPL